jgi:serine/threonine protein kinase
VSESQPPRDRPSRNRRLIDQICRQFERDYRQSNRCPAIEDFIDLVSTELQRDLLCELIVVELELKASSGLSNSIEVYLDRFEQFSDIVHRAFAESRTALDKQLRAASEAKIPTTLGDFQVIREVGRGGMGIVFEAVQHSLHRRVALKVLPSHYLSRPDRIARFHQEASAVARLHHSHIVQVYGVGESDGNHFFAMQFIDGRSISEIIRGSGIDGPARAFEMTDCDDESTNDRPVADLEETVDCAAQLILDDVYAGVRNKLQRASHISPIKVGRIAGQVAEALAYAHDRGILHRDVKPSNLMLDNDDNVWLTDFGLAKVIDDDSSSMTESGDLIGTLRYLAPEAIRGNWSAQSDVYGLGATMYEMLVGRAAFADRDRATLIQRIIKSDFVPPRRLVKSIPKKLETIILKSMAGDLDKRYQSAQEVSDELSRFNRGLPIRAQQSTIMDRFREWSQRNRWVTTVAAICVAILTVVVITTTFLWQKAETATTLAEFEHKSAVKSANQARLTHRALVTTHEKLKQANEIAEHERLAARQAKLQAEKRLGESLNLMSINAMEKQDFRLALQLTKSAKQLLESLDAPNPGEVLPLEKAISLRLDWLNGRTVQPLLVTTLETTSKAFERFRKRRSNTKHWLTMAFDSADEILEIRDRVSGLRMALDIETGKTRKQRITSVPNGQLICDAGFTQAVKLDFELGTMSRTSLPENLAVSRQLTKIERERLVEIVVSPDNRMLLVTTMKNGKVKLRVWNEQDELLWSIDLPGSFHNSVFGRDSKTLFVGGETIRAFETENFAEQTFSDESLGPIKSKLIATQSGLLVTSATETKLYQQRFSQLAIKRLLRMGSALQSCFAVDQENRRFIVGRTDGVIEFHSFDESVPLVDSTRLAEFPIRLLELSPNGILFASDSQGLTGMWNANTGMRVNATVAKPNTTTASTSNDSLTISANRLRALYREMSVPIVAAKWSNSGDKLATLDAQGVINVLPFKRRPTQPIETSVSDVSESSRGEWLAYCHSNELPKQQTLTVQSVDRYQSFRAAIAGTVKRCCMLPDGQKIVVISQVEPRSSEVSFFEIEDDSLHCAAKTSFKQPARELNVAFSADSSTATVWSASHSQSYRFGERNALSTRHYKRNLKSFAVSSDGRRNSKIVDIGTKESLSLRVFDRTSSETFSGQIERHHVVSSMDFIHNDRSVLVGGNRGLSVFDFAKKELTEVPFNGSRSSVSKLVRNSRDDRFMVATSLGDVFVLDSNSLEVVGSAFQVVGEIVQIGFGPLPGTAVVVTRRNGVQLWDWTRGQPLSPNMFVDEPIQKAIVRQTADISPNRLSHANLLVLTESGELRLLNYLPSNQLN